MNTNIITLDTIATVSAQNTGKLAMSVLANARANFFTAKIQSISLPAGVGSFVMETGETIEFNPTVLLARYVSLAACGLDSAPSNFPYGSISKGVTVPEWALLSAPVTTATRTVKSAPVAITPENLLIAAIRETINLQIKDLQETLRVTLGSSDLLHSYMLQVADGQPLYAGSLAVDTTEVVQAIGKEKLKEKIAQIESVFVGTKTECDCTIADDMKTIEVQLMSWDKANTETVLTKLEGFNLYGAFAKDTGGILAKLQCQILTVKI